MSDDEEAVGTRTDLVDNELFSRELPIEYYGSEDIAGMFADQAMVSHSTGMFTLSFFQMQVPPTQDLDVLQKVEKIPARCVAKIVLAPQLMEQFFVALEGNIKRHQKLIAAFEKSKE
jgi:hypothetical protein